MPFVLPLAVSVYGAVGSPRWIGQTARCRCCPLLHHAHLVPVAGDGDQVSVVEEWTAATPGGLADPPRRTDRSVDGNRQRQYEWHCGFVDRVTEPTATGPSPAPTARSAWFGRFGGLSAHLSSTVAEVRNEPRRSRQVLRYSAVT